MLIFNNNKFVEPNVNTVIQSLIKNAVLSVLGTHSEKISPLENPKQQSDREQRHAA